MFKMYTKKYVLNVPKNGHKDVRIICTYYMYIERTHLCTFFGYVTR
jgi:hypothetical protein